MVTIHSFKKSQIDESSMRGWPGAGQKLSFVQRSIGQGSLAAASLLRAASNRHLRVWILNWATAHSRQQRTRGFLARRRSICSAHGKGGEASFSRARNECWAETSTPPHSFAQSLLCFSLHRTAEYVAEGRTRNLNSAKAMALTA